MADIVIVEYPKMAKYSLQKVWCDLVSWHSEENEMLHVFWQIMYPQENRYQSLPDIFLTPYFSANTHAAFVTNVVKVTVKTHSWKAHFLWNHISTFHLSGYRIRTQFCRTISEWESEEIRKCMLTWEKWAVGGNFPVTTLLILQHSAMCNIFYQYE